MDVFFIIYIHYSNTGLKKVSNAKGRHEMIKNAHKTGENVQERSNALELIMTKVHASTTKETHGHFKSSFFSTFKNLKLKR